MRIYAYLRYSSVEQTGNTSLDTQRQSIRSFVDRMPDLRGHEVIERADEARTGTTFSGRRAFASIVKDVQAGDAVVVFKYDRLGRSLLESLQQLDCLEHEKHVRVYSATEPNDEVARNLLLTMAQEYSRQLSTRVTLASQNIVRGGGVSNHWPYGYTAQRPDPKSRAKLKVVPEQAAVVKRIFEFRAGGLPFREVARRLNRERTPASKGGLWSVAAIHNMLCNEIYLGRMITGQRRFKKGKGYLGRRPRSEWTICDNAHEAIIAPELWAAVRAHDSETCHSHKVTRTRRHPHLWTGFLYCAHCGSPLMRQVSKKDHAYYGCDGVRRHGVKECPSSRCLVRTDEIDSVVWPLITEQLARELQDWAKKVVTAARRYVENALAQTGEAIAPLNSSLQKLDKEIEAAEKRLLFIPEDSLQTCLKELAKKKADRDFIKAKIATAESSTRKVDPAELEAQLHLEVTKLFVGINKGEVPVLRERLAQHIERIDIAIDRTAVLHPKPDGLLAGLAAANPVWGASIAGMGLEPTLGGF